MPETIFDPAAGIVRCEHKKAAIIGTGRSRNIAPWEDDSYCWFGLNEIFMPRADRFYEMHPLSVQSPNEMAWLKASWWPVYTLEYEPSIPLSVRYPLERVLAMPGARDWFTSTFSYQVALAVLDGFEEIGVWGVDLRRGTLRERTVEWGCLGFWLGYAAGRGVKITLPEGEISWSHPGRYGYDYWEEKDGVERQMADLRQFCGQTDPGKGIGG